MNKKTAFVVAATVATCLTASSAFATMPLNDDVLNTKGKTYFSGQFKVASKFNDVANSDWSIRFITEMSAKGVINGYGNGKFQPSANVSQQEAITMTMRAMGLDDEAKALNLDSSVKLNVQNETQIAAWAKPYLAIAVEKGFLDADTELNPTAKADREWITEWIVRAMGLETEAEAHMEDTLTFKDAGEVDADAVGYVAVAVEKGIINGYPDRTFQPNKPVKRNELAKILCNAEHLFEYDEDRQEQTQGQLNGTIKTTATTSLTFTTKTHADVTYQYASNFFVFVGDKIAAATDLQAGMAVRVFLNAQGEIVFVHAKQEAPTREEIETHAHGTIIAYTAPQGTTEGSITLEQQTRGKLQGKTEARETKKLKLAVATDTQVTLNAQTKSVSDVKIGDRVQLDIVNDTVLGIDILPDMTKQLE